MERKGWLDTIGVLLIALVMVVGYKLSPLLLPVSDQVVQPDPGCNLHRQACTVDLPQGGKIVLTMGTRPVPLIKPFSLRVDVQGFVADQIEVDFAGVDMNMGLNRPVLKPEADGGYVAQTSLPVCITGGMDWQVTVLLDRGRERLAIPFRLIAGAHE